MSELMPHINEDALRKLPSQVSVITQRLLLLVGIAGTVITFAAEWTHGHHFLSEWLLKNVDILGALLNLLLVTLVLLPGPIQPLQDDVRDRTVHCAARCINAFCLPALTWFWRSLGLIYVVQLFRSIASNHPHEALVLSTATNPVAPLATLLIELLSACSTYFILLAYCFLAPVFLRTYITEAVKTREEEQLRHLNRWREKPVVWQSLAGIALIGGIVLSIQVHLPSWPFPDRLDEGSKFANGLVSAIAFALFVGRMDSKFVLNWQWAIPLLFLYAGIQVFSRVLSSPAPFERAAFVYAAFTMKCVLFIFLSNLFESRRVLYYAVSVVEFRGRQV